MKRLITISGIVIVMLAATFAATAALSDYTGTWILDQDKSKGLPTPPPGVNYGTVQIEMTVTQDGKQFNIKSNMFGGQDIFYNLDGSKSKAQMGKLLMTGEATVYLEKKDDGKIVLHSQREITSQGQPLTLESTETWELADGGKTLKVNRITESSRGKHEVSLVFTRKS
ncbi:MAG: hypothetical protein QOC96_1422 [Acidobacteriota bacterium]|jgi:hypothetical protein|nr:hypothetical protein [Acidobacteriota bacterium]